MDQKRVGHAGFLNRASFGDWRELDDGNRRRTVMEGLVEDKKGGGGRFGGCTEQIVFKHYKVQELTTNENGSGEK
jgi:hypothetical protein